MHIHVTYRFLSNPMCKCGNFTCDECMSKLIIMYVYTQSQCCYQGCIPVPNYEHALVPAIMHTLL